MIFCLLLPSSCRLCGAKLWHAQRLPVCEACLSAVAPLPPGACPRCGKLVPRSPRDSGTPAVEAIGACPSCQIHSPDYDAALSSAAHTGAARELIHLLKYRGVIAAASFWAARLAPLAGRLPGACDLVVPVPLGRKRQRQRGFNQSAEISRRLARRLGRRHAPSALARRRETAAQAGLDAAARQRNLDRAFAASPHHVAGRRVLLVDDVLTTGATASAAAGALKRAGAASVYLLTATRADLWDTLPGVRETAELRGAISA